MKKILLVAAATFMGISSIAFAQKDKQDLSHNVFTTVKDVRITSVKDQANSGTCWAYSGQGFFEDEILRNGGPSINLSEMFVASHSYKDKARKFVRLHGSLNYAEGGSFYDVLYVLKNYGAVPYSVMPGLNYGTKKNMFSEMMKASKAFLDVIITNPNGKLSTAWGRAFDGIIDSYLGKLPTTFKWHGKEYTPKTFAKSLKLNPDDYVSITSYTHHPFYSQFALAIPDNWRWALSYNVPIGDLMRIIENAINNNYSVAWGASINTGFTRDGLAVLPDVEAIETKGSDQDRWVGLSTASRRAMIQKMIERADVPEINPTQAYRQECYDTYQLTDDHGMVIFGTAKNQIGRKFFMVKNSWGDTGNYHGIWYASWDYVAGKTMNIVVNKHALPKDIAAKLGIKL